MDYRLGFIASAAVPIMVGGYRDINLKGEVFRPPSFPIMDHQLEVITAFPIIVGGHADIYKGEVLCGSSGVPKVIAIKRFRYVPEDKIVKRFHAVVEALKDLNNPHVMPLLGVACDLNVPPTVAVPYFSMGNILNYNRRDLDINRIQQATEIASGLAYLHSNGVIHGNLTPSNILINDDGMACLVDYGLSNIINELGTAQRSARYMAPELLHDGRLPVTSMSDVYSYGSVCYEIFTGQRPFDNISSEFDVILAVYNHEHPPRPPSTHIASSRGLDDRMWALITKCWNASAGKRPTASTLCNSLATTDTCSPTIQANDEVGRTRTEEERNHMPAVNIRSAVNSFEELHNLTRDEPLIGLNASSRL